MFDAWLRTGSLKHPNTQAEITKRIVSWLDQHNQQNTHSNSEIVCVLLDFKASQMADSIRSALDAKYIGVCGDWDEIRSELSSRK